MCAPYCALVCACTRVPCCAPYVCVCLLVLALTVLRVQDEVRLLDGCGMAWAMGQDDEGHGAGWLGPWDTHMGALLTSALP